MITFDSLEKDKPLKEFSTWKIGGPACFFLEVSSVQIMQEAMVFCSAEKLSFLVIGKGSNCLFHDLGFKGLVILNKIDFIHQTEGLFDVGAGYHFSLLGTQTARNHWSGLEFASGIPGSVGGAVFMNAGANGAETCNSLVQVEFVNQEGTIQLFEKRELSFDYRYSSFQEMKGAITSAKFQLTHSPEARQKQLDLIQYRLTTQPYKEPSAGCVFRNPSKSLNSNCLSAGALIEQAGLKAYCIGGAKVSEKHANFIVNADKATSQDVLELIDYVKIHVKEKTGIELCEEIRCIPYEPRQNG
jgi:UDP-N-acetylmuramate dehydrogenase